MSLRFPSNLEASQGLHHLCVDDRTGPPSAKLRSGITNERQNQDPRLAGFPEPCPGARKAATGTSCGLHFPVGFPAGHPQDP